MQWQNVGRPGYLGARRGEKYAEWDKKYGRGNWRLVWMVNDNVFDFLGVCALYEDAYFAFLNAYPEIIQQLITEACNVYDDEVSNVESGLDYTGQETGRTHIQDIAIRNCLVRLGVWFRGEELVRIRDKDGNHPLSITLSPGQVPFHKIDWILKPEEIGWWAVGSVEAFYQTNRILQVIQK